MLYRGLSHHARRAVWMSPGFRVAQIMAAIFTVAAVSAFMPLWFADRGLSPSEIGQVLGLASLFRVISGPGWGTMADRVGRRRPVMTFAACTAMAMSLTYTVVYSFTPILLVAAVLAIAASALGPLADSLALALTREGKMEYGPVRAAGSISYMVVTAAAGQGLAHLGAAVVPWLQALGYALAAVF
ncbi:MAG: MFS transporter, partial [Acetobacteraceae bacterium]